MIKIKRIVFPLIHLIFFTMLLMAAGQDQNGKLYPVRQHGKWGYIDTKGQVVIRHIYSLTRGWSEGLNPVVSSGEKWSFIKRDERLIPKEADILWLLTSELTVWRASIRASPDQSSYKTRASHSGPTNCWSDAHSITRP